MLDSDGEYFTAEESDGVDSEYLTADDSDGDEHIALSIPYLHLPNFVVWTSQDGTVWYIPEPKSETASVDLGFTTRCPTVTQGF